LNAPLLIKLDRVLSYGALDILAGGNGEQYQTESVKEMTVIELTILKNLGLKIIEDLNAAWTPIENIKLEYIRTEINSQFIAFFEPECKVIRISLQVEFGLNKGTLEILYPYSTLFPVRDQLFSNLQG